MLRIIILFSLFFITVVVNAQNDSLPAVVKIGDKVFNKVEVEAYFPGGVEAWKKYLAKKLDSNVPANNGAPVGLYKVIVKFVVDRTGKTSDIQPETNNGYGTEEEVVRVIERSGNWIPAIQDGRPVNAYRCQPVTFAVEQDGLEFNTKDPYVFYVGMNNELEIKIAKVKDEDLEVTITEGTITQKGDGRYIVKVSKPGKVIVEVFNTRKKGKSVGIGSFEVKDPNKPLTGTVPTPTN